MTGSDDCCDFDQEFFLFRRADDGRFQARESVRMQFDSLNSTRRTRVSIADWDQDGRLDLIMQENEVPGLRLAPGPLADRDEIGFARRIDGSQPVRIPFTAPHVVDWNGDGLPDLQVGMREPDGAGVYLLKGADHPDGIRLAALEQLVAAPRRANVSGLDVADWDGDGMSDLIVGLSWPRRDSRSQIWVYRRIPSR